MSGLFETTKFNSAITIYDEDDAGKRTVNTIILKSEIVGISIASDDEYMLNIFLRSGSKVDVFCGYDTDVLNDIMLQTISDLGWS